MRIVKWFAHGTGGGEVLIKILPDFEFCCVEYFFDVCSQVETIPNRFSRIARLLLQENAADLDVACVLKDYVDRL